MIHDKLDKNIKNNQKKFKRKTGEDERGKRLNARNLTNEK